MPGCQGIDEYRAILPAALRNGIMPAQAKARAAGNISVGNSKELLIRVVSSNLPFIGYPRTLNALSAIEEATK